MQKFLHNLNVGDLQSLVNQRYKEVTTNANNAYSAAFQLALWEIVNETSGSYDLENGSFKASNRVNQQDTAFLAARATAQTWLSLAGPTTGQYKISYLFDFNGEATPNTQNLITMSPVPLPAAGLLMASALGLGGLFSRRRANAKK